MEIILAQYTCKWVRNKPNVCSPVQPDSSNRTSN